MIVIETFLSCDGSCGRNFGIDNRSLPAKEQRNQSHWNGWVTIKGKDYCPDCKPLKSMSPREKEKLNELKKQGVEYVSINDVLHWIYNIRFNQRIKRAEKLEQK